MANDTGNDTAMTPVFSSSNHDAEMEALAIKGLLDSNDIPAVVVGSQVLPTLEFQVQVPEDLLDIARKTIRDARQGGRHAADEAEAASEK
jgi:hypothetical protein